MNKEELKWEIREVVREILYEELKKGIQLEDIKGGKTWHLRNAEVHVAAATPKLHLEGTETNGIDSQLKEDAGAISIVDLTSTGTPTLLKLFANTPIEFDVAVPVIFETAITEKAADATGVQFTSENIKPALMHYAKSAAIEATWDASHTDSITDIELYDETVTGGAVIVKVSDNKGTDVKSATYEPITEGNKLVVRVNVTKASTTTGATTNCSKAVVYFRVSLA